MARLADTCRNFAISIEIKGVTEERKLPQVQQMNAFRDTEA